MQKIEIEINKQSKQLTKKTEIEIEEKNYLLASVFSFLLLCSSPDLEKNGKKIE